jgi:transcriptional regulator with XRE-family HTH domain
MDKRRLSYRALAEATRSIDGQGMTHAHINMLANGHDRPSMRAMELIAKACKVRPDYFAEYRLTVAMRELDPGEVGLERALANLNDRLMTNGSEENPHQTQDALPPVLTRRKVARIPTGRT